MFKKIFILIFFLFVFSLFKNSHIVSAEVLMECHGLKNYKNWCAGEYKGNEAKSCIMISTPINEKGEPPYKSRGEIYTTIYHIPSEDSNGVMYITTGYTYKKDTLVTIQIDKNKKYEFNVIENDTAFSDDANVDKQIIVEMKKGNNMKVVGFSSRGTKTTDTYSLVGFSAAYAHISNLCNVTN